MRSEEVCYKQGVAILVANPSSDRESRDVAGVVLVVKWMEQDWFDFSVFHCKNGITAIVLVFFIPSWLALCVHMIDAYGV